MQTSSFQFNREHPFKKPVSVAFVSPLDFKGREYILLKPYATEYGKFRRGEMSEEEYSEYYNEEILGGLSPEGVYKDLGSDSTLLCWEPSGKFCHRRLIAEWLERNICIKIPEVWL